MAAGTTPTRGISYVITPEQHLLRGLVAIALWVVGLVLIIVAVKIFLDSYYWALFLGVPLWAIGVAATIRWRIVLVTAPEVAATIITNPYVGVNADPFRNQIVLPTGTWFKFPWEVEQDGLIINLRQVAQEFDEDFPCLDGVPIRVRGSFTYRGDVDLLPRYIAVDDTVINEALVNLATGYLSRVAAGQNAETSRGMIEDFQRGLVNMFDDPTTAGIVARGEERALTARGRWALTVDHIFGISFNQLQVGDVAYSDAYQLVLEQRARQGQIEAAITRQVDAFIAASGGTAITATERQGIVSEVLVAFNLTKRDAILLEGSADSAIATILAGMAGFFRRS